MKIVLVDKQNNSIEVYGPKGPMEQWYTKIWTQIKKSPQPGMISGLCCGYAKNMKTERKVMFNWSNMATIEMEDCDAKS